MNALERALRDFLAVRPSVRSVALVGGVAVSARTEPRFTRDLDFAVALTDDSEAEEYVFRLRQLGYHLLADVEQTSQGRIATVRLRRHGRGPLVDLLFASCGIEREIVIDAETIEIMTGLTTDVARTGHLIAMKLLSRNDEHRPRDHDDLLALGKVADEVEWARAAAGVRLIMERGFGRSRDLVTALAELRARLAEPMK